MRSLNLLGQKYFLGPTFKKQTEREKRRKETGEGRRGRGREGRMGVNSVRLRRLSHSPGVRTLHFQCRGHRFDPWSES